MNDDFAVADSGNNRVIIISGQGVIKTIFGDTEKGLEDGSPTKARFNSPQGLAYSNGQLYVADTNNHCIRKVISCHPLDLSLLTIYPQIGPPQNSPHRRTKK